ncbi:MAG: hypothetical protein JRF49_12975 [Deltaproteobacteria bacterium]|jgi:hypothetical protein|nr:hypothetical protein [Deltaproteobacteria bacterium]
MSNLVKPNSVIPKLNDFLIAHIKVYPEGFNPDGSYRKDYNAKMDPYINPLLRQLGSLPNRPDGRVHNEIIE